MYAYVHWVYDNMSPDVWSRTFTEPIPVPGGSVVVRNCEFLIAGTMPDDYTFDIKSPIIRRGTVEWTSLGEVTIIVKDHQRRGFGFTPSAHFNGFRQGADNLVPQADPGDETAPASVDGEPGDSD